MKVLNETEIIRTPHLTHTLGKIGEIKFSPCYYQGKKVYEFLGSVSFKLGYSWDLGTSSNAKNELIKKTRLLLLDALRDLEMLDNDD